MELLEAIQQRHSVRSFTDKQITDTTLEQLEQAVAECNRESGLSIQLCLNEPTAFAGRIARYGRFVNTNNYIALVGQKGPDLDEKGGYYGQKLVLRAQQLGLTTCWVAATFSKGKSKAVVTINPGEKLLMVIALGYGTTAGTPHRGKPVSDLYKATEPVPDWFMNGMQAAQLAPTAMNQQKFTFELDGKTVKALPGIGFHAKVDLGIVKYHFEVGAGKENFSWG